MSGPCSVLHSSSLPPSWLLLAATCCLALTVPCLCLTHGTAVLLLRCHHREKMEDEILEDGLGTGWIHRKNLEQLMERLPEPLGFSELDLSSEAAKAKAVRKVSSHRIHRRA